MRIEHSITPLKHEVLSHLFYPSIHLLAQLVRFFSGTLQNIPLGLWGKWEQFHPLAWSMASHVEGSLTTNFVWLCSVVTVFHFVYVRFEDKMPFLVYCLLSYASLQIILFLFSSWYIHLWKSRYISQLITDFETDTERWFCFKV